MYAAHFGIGIDAPSTHAAMLVIADLLDTLEKAGATILGAVSIHKEDAALHNVIKRANTGRDFADEAHVPVGKPATFITVDEPSEPNPAPALLDDPAQVAALVEKAKAAGLIKRATKGMTVARLEQMLAEHAANPPAAPAPADPPAATAPAPADLPPTTPPVRRVTVEDGVTDGDKNSEHPPANPPAQIGTPTGPTPAPGCEHEEVRVIVRSIIANPKLGMPVVQQVLADLKLKNVTTTPVDKLPALKAAMMAAAATV